MQSRSEQRGESDYESVWVFRLERYDEAGNRAMLVPVEMRGRTFEGSISEGDWVRARGRMRAGTLRATELENLTSGATVRAKRVPMAVLIVFCLLFLAMLAWIGWLAYTGFSGGGPGALPDLP